MSIAGEFYRDVSDKKRTSYGAFHKKGGSKSRACSLPSDTLTARQLKERNGKMYTYNLDAPMSWDNFKNLPDDAQRNYIHEICKKYNANIAAFAEMFGAKENAVFAYFKSHNLKDILSRGAHGKYNRMNAEQRKAWLEFYHPSAEPAIAADAVCEDDEVPVQEPVCVEIAEENVPVRNEAANVRFEEPQKKSAVRAMMSRFDIELRGMIDSAMVANTLRSILGEGTDGILSLSFHPAEA